MKGKGNKKINKILIGQAICIGALALIVTALYFIMQDAWIAENIFARRLSRWYGAVAGRFASLFPFSLFDVFVTVGIAALIICLVLFVVYLVKKKGKKALAMTERLLIAALVVLITYQCTASGNYYRDPLPLEKYEGEQLADEELADYVSVLLADFAAVGETLEKNEDGSTVCPYDFETINDLLHAEYAQLGEYYNDFVPDAKEGWYSFFLSYEHITGITFLPTGDAVVNKETPDTYKVVTTAHELAHAAGVMRESEANLTAYYLLLTSETPYLRYCGYIYCINYLTGILYRQNADLYNDVMQNYPACARVDRQLDIDFWASKDSIFEEIGEFMNDVYLKFSGADNGTGSYSDPSSVSYEKGEGEKVIVKVSYSTTARVLLQIAMNR